MRGLASTRRCSASLLISRIWPIVGVLASAPKNGLLARRAVDRGRLEQLPAVEDRLGVDPRRAAAGGADLEEHVRCDVSATCADAAEDRAGDDLGAGLQRLERDVVAVEAEDLGEVGLEGRRSRARLAGRGAGARRRSCRRRARRVGEQALLGDAPGGGVGASRPAAVAAAFGDAAALAAAAAGAGGAASAPGRSWAARAPWRPGAGCRLRLGHRDAVRDLLQVRVRVGVAVDVAQLDEAPEALASCRSPTMRPSWTAMTGEPRLGEDVDAAAAGVGLDRQRGVRGPCATLRWRRSERSSA